MVMEMFEILFVCAGIVVAILCVAFVAKLVLSILMLPIHLGLFLVKGLLVLLFAVPAVILTVGIASLVPIALVMIIGLPVLAVVGGIVLLIKFLT